MKPRAARRLATAAAIVALAVLAVPSTALGQDAVSAGLNVRVLSGTFGSSQTTRIVYAPAVLRIDAHRFELSASLPFLMIDAGTVTPSQGGLVPMQGSLAGAPSSGMPAHAGGMMGQSGTSYGTSIGATSMGQSGVGDVVAGAGYRLIDNASSGVQLVAGLRVKIPTASAERGLGTGKTDLGGILAVRKRFGSGWVYAEGGYVAVGAPAGADLRDVAVWSAGAGRRLTARWYLLASGSGSTAIVPAFGAPAEIGAGVGVKAGDRLIVTILPTFGLSNASPKYALTIGISTDLLRR